MELRLPLMTLDQHADIGRLSFTADEVTEPNQRELNVMHKHGNGLSANLYTYAQSVGYYALQLHYPFQLGGVSSLHVPMQALRLEKTIELPCMQFELS